MKLVPILLSFILLVGRMHGQSTVEMRHEATADLRKSEADLDDAYNQLLAKFDQKVQDTKLREKLKFELEQSQAAWLKFRTVEARIRNDLNTPEGTMAALSSITSLQEVTDERTRQLKKYLKDALIFE